MVPRLAALAGRLDALSPLAVLGRGYALVTRGGRDGAVVTDAASLSPGERIGARLARGALEARVESVEPSDIIEDPDDQA